MGELFAGKFELGEHLGEGAMCVVQRARHLALGRVVALKIPKAFVLAVPIGRARFLREARTMSRLHHANIVQIFEVGETEALPYIAMELVEGGTLAKLLLDPALTLGGGLGLMAQVAAALVAAHGQGVIHRDLKPANVLVSRQLEAKVADWGLARAADDTQLSRTGNVLGTPQYLSPEVARGRPATPRSDLYALGLMLYELASSTTPGAQRLTTDRFMEHLRGQLPPLGVVAPACPEPLLALVADLTAFDPDGRPSGTDAVAERLAGVVDQVRSLEGVAPLAGEPTRTEELPPRSRAARHLTTDRLAPVSKSSANATPLSWAWLPLVAVAVLAGALWALGRGPSRGSLPVAGAELREPLLTALDEVVLRFSGAPSGRCRLVVGGEGSSARKPPVSCEVDLAGATPLSHGSFGARCPLPAVLSGPVVASCVLLDAAGAASTQPVSWTLDPSRLLRELLGPVDDLAGARSAKLVKRAVALRQSVAGAPAERRQEAERELRAELAAAGLDEAGSDRLRRYLPALLRAEGRLDGPVARRITPLRELEAALADQGGLVPPWGGLDAALGISSAPHGWYEPVLPLPGMVSVGRSDLVTQVRSTTAGGRLLPRWIWMLHEDQRRRVLSQDGLGGLVTDVYAEAAREYRPHPRDYLSVVDLPLVVTPPAGRPWPPRSAVLYLAVRSFVRGYALSVRVNGSPAAVLVNTFKSGVGDAAKPYEDSLWVSWPVGPDELQPGQNRVTVQVLVLPGDAPVVALALRELGAWVPAAP